jgi:Flp pilus assembly protein TadD
MTREVGRYRILSPLGRGAMGVVYLAEDPLLRRQVAIKTVDLSVEEESQREFLRERLLRDARAAAALAHPNIVGVYDVLEEGGTAYLVMEFVSGETLDARLKRTPRPEPLFVARVIREMAEALDYTHARGIIHRDIKPANVMIDASGITKIMDFGIARICDTRTSTPTGLVMGTVQYMAPEQVKGEALDGRADQFALAAVAYEMLTGSTLFGEHSLATLAYKIVNEPVAPVRSKNGALPATVDAAVGRALSKSPAERYATCGSFAAALGTALIGGSAVANATTVTMVMRPPSKPKWGLAAAGATAVLAAGLGLGFWHPWSKPAAPTAAVTAATTETQAPPVPPATPGTPPARTAEKQPVRAPEKAEAKKQEKKTPEKLPPVEADDSDRVEPEAGAETPAAHPVLDALHHGQEMFKQGQYPGAIQAFNQALAINPKYAPAYSARGMVYQKQEQFEAAIKDYSDAVRLAPQAVTYSNRGVCYTRLNKYDLALADFNLALGIRPQLVLAYNGRGRLYLQEGKPQDAIKDFSEAIRLAPNGFMGYQNRAAAKRAMGDRAGAREDAQKAHALRQGG